ncbi:DNA polymerase epsilon subunit D [Verticillium dahliae VDG2]|nr:DNA polymerase epsilon subunit D [Verticillium dahliae VDG2]
MPSDKNRLYLALYARGGQGYHWALLVGPKHEDVNASGKGYHAKLHMLQWRYDELEIPMAASNMILVRVLAAKVKRMERLESIMRSVPVRPDVPDWTSRSWVEEACKKLQSDGKAIGSCPDWETLSNTALWYVQKKMEEHRFDGLAPPGQFSTWQVSTWTRVEGQELIL